MGAVVLFMAGADEPIILHEGKAEEGWSFPASKNIVFDEIGLGEKNSGLITVTHESDGSVHYALVTANEIVMGEPNHIAINTSLDVGDQVEGTIYGVAVRIVHNSSNKEIDK
ncbi:MAG: hypothetical protein AAB557_01370 [Patescibacteria group bacterium]